VDGKRIFDSDQVHCLEEIPRELIVVGAGIIGLEYASMFAALGVKVTLLDQAARLVRFCRSGDHRKACASNCGSWERCFASGEGRFGRLDEERDKVFATLESGKKVRGQALLYTIGRQANSDKLNLDAAGLQTGDRGKLAVNEHFQTTVPHIYAAGDVIGFPALASTSMEQRAAGGLPYVR